MKLKKNNLIDMVIDAVAFVDKGANRKKYFLLKREGENMDKESVLAILKAGNVNDEQKELLLKQLNGEDRKEVEKALEDNSRDNKNAEEFVEKIIEKAGKKFSKETEGKIQELKNAVDKIKSIIDGMAKAMGADEKYKYPDKEEKDKKDIKKMLEDPEADIPDDQVEEAFDQLFSKNLN